MEDVDMEIRGRLDDERSILCYLRRPEEETTFLKDGYDLVQRRDIRYQNDTYVRCASLLHRQTMLNFNSHVDLNSPSTNRFLLFGSPLNS